MEYCNSFFQSDDEIHAIVNFTLNTTNKLAKISSDLLDVVVYDYVEKEELSAKTLFSGTSLANYQININTGEASDILSKPDTSNLSDADNTSATESTDVPEDTTDIPEDTSNTINPSGDMVWIDDTGKKYHAKSSCSNMNDPYQVPRADAEAMGRDACKKCY